MQIVKPGCQREITQTTRKLLFAQLSLIGAASIAPKLQQKAQIEGFGRVLHRGSGQSLAINLIGRGPYQRNCMQSWWWLFPRETGIIKWRQQWIARLCWPVKTAEKVPRAIQYQFAWSTTFCSVGMPMLRKVANLMPKDEFFIGSTTAAEV